jgi:hypothetical protein
LLKNSTKCTVPDLLVQQAGAQLEVPQPISNALVHLLLYELWRIDRPCMCIGQLAVAASGSILWFYQRHLLPSFAQQQHRLHSATKEYLFYDDETQQTVLVTPDLLEIRTVSSLNDW